MPKPIVLNPTLEENLALVCKLVATRLGKAPGRLKAYKVYSLPDAVGGDQNYVLTHPLIQFNADPLIAADLKQQTIIDIYEPLVEGAGSSGSIYPVVRSIIAHDGMPVFDNKNYVLKKVHLPDLSFDKPHKPPAVIRAVRREQYIGSHFLGSYYQAYEEPEVAFLHMDRAPGNTIGYFWNKLNEVQFLSLACALLEQIPPQLQQIISYGKHSGKRIVHCDITANNILADFNEGKWTVKLVDFGSAKAQNSDECYPSKKARGTRWHYDATMFRSSQKKETIVFTKETDLYALYNVIVELAGNCSRVTKRGHHESLLRDLDSPDLDSLFQEMDFPPPIKIQLTTLIQGMLSADRSSRLSVDVVLDGFKRALTSIDSPPSLLAPCEEEIPEPPVSIDALERLMNHPINADIESLKTWIIIFNRIYNRLSEAEQNEVMHYARQFKTKNYYSDLYIRFYDLIKGYDEPTSARLLIRHASLITRISKYAGAFEPSWGTKYYQLINNLDLQISEEDKAFCNNLVQFQKTQLAIYLHDEDNECTRPIFEHLETLLKAALLMPMEEWLKILPEFIEDFSQKYQFLLMLNALFEEIKLLSQTALFSADFLTTATRWFVDFSTESIKAKELSPELINEVNLRVKLFRELNNYQDLVYEIQSGLHEDIVLTKACIDYTPEAINRCISNLKFDDSKQINLLLQRLELQYYLHFISNCLLQADSFLNKYPRLGTKISEQLEGIVGRYIELELNEQVMALYNHLNIIHQLNQCLNELAEELDDLDAIKQSIPYLLDDPEIAQQALATIKSNSSYMGLKIYLRNLNAGLNRALVEESDVNLKLLAEYQSFYQDPSRYSPYCSALAAQSIFQPAKTLIASGESTTPTLPLF